MTLRRESSSTVPALLLTVLLLMLAFRLTCTETLRESILQKQTRLEAGLHPSDDLPAVPLIGPAWTAGYLTASCLIAAGAAFVAARRGLLTLRRGVQFLLIAVIVAILFASAWHAEGRF